MLEKAKGIIDLAVKIAHLLVEYQSVHDADTACTIAEEIAALRVRKNSFGRFDHRLPK
jgi:hypothetical protein